MLEVSVMYSKPSDKKVKIVMLTLITLILLSIIFLVNSYNGIQRRINQSSEDYLTKTNEYAVNILENSIDKCKILIEEQQKDIIELLNTNNKNDTELLSLINSSNSEVIGIYLLDSDKKLLNSYRFGDNSDASTPKMPDDFIKLDKTIESFDKSKVVDNGKEFFLNGKYYLNIYVYSKINNLIIIAPIDLQKLFKNNIQSEESIYNGYTMVKNETFKVIMHPSDDQIGLNIIEDRKKLYPDYNFEGLEKLENIQSKESDGTIYYDSYWWNQKKPSKANKLTSFKWVTIGKSKWVVATNSDLKERQGLTIENTVYLLSLFIIFIIVFILFYFLIKQYQNQYKNYLTYKALKQRHEEERLRYKIEKKMEQDSKLEIIGIFSASIVHDLNNILTPLIGLTSLLMEENEDNHSLYSDLKSIYVSAEKGKKLSNNILSFFQTESKRREKINIFKEIESAVHMLQPIIPKAVKVKIIILDDNLKEMSSIFETQDIQSILINLITNAVQAIGEKSGNIDLEITTGKIDESDNSSEYFLIKVIDNGPGIPLDIKEEILYSPFFTTKGADGGTGLGLFVVTSLIKKNSWKIKLESNSTGTSFIIGIPMDKII